MDAPLPGPAVLRPALFALLKRRFPSGVKVANAGMAMVSVIDERGRRVCDARKYQGHTPGEYYRVCCPFCRDDRFRLYINHRWGFPDPSAGGSRNLWLAHCMNENCLSDYEMQKSLYDEVFHRVAEEIPDTLNEGALVPAGASHAVTEPGVVVRLDSLPPDHRAIRYLMLRGYDPLELSDRHGVGYVLDPPDDLFYLKGRVYIPVLVDGKLVGYQCRFVGDPSDKTTPKYLFSRGFPRSSVLYNFDEARRHPWVCLLEGATKVWRFGPEGVASFGKEVTGHQVHLLSQGWDKIVIMLDPNARKKSEGVLAVLKTVRPKTAVVNLPDGVEPDEIPSEEARGYAHRAAREAGFDL